MSASDSSRDPASSRNADSSRDLDLVVFGTTGFVGRLVAEYLAKAAPANARIGLAGRSLTKLEAVRASLGPAAAEWPLIVADANDSVSIADLVARTRAVATTVGPYAKYGRLLVDTCADLGTHYVDLTGEALFVRDSIDANHNRAITTGTKIVHSCGFDSIPSDLGVHVLHQAVVKDGEGELTDTTLVVTDMRGGVSGGTIDSLRTQVTESVKDPSLRRLAASPYTLSPDRAAEPDLGRQTDVEIVKAAKVDPKLRGWLAPFVMASYNTRIVRRTNSLRNWVYGRKFRYREAMSVGSSPLSLPIAAGVAAGMGALVAGLALRPTRALLDRVLPKPGEGPSEESRNKGRFTMDIFTTTSTGARYSSRVRAHGDPGYQATAVMLGEAALALIDDEVALPESTGVLTPATAFGDVLVDRLRDAGFEFSTRRL
ncbi:MAG: enoyl-ACP reductase [Rhodococcus sp.]|nr:enoyl-ACP reductase [Rhodococcus sp. (in: high G+C Gram-positive bacteria)]